MQITRKSLITGKVHTREINVSHAQLAAWHGGMLIQKAMPNLSEADREFILNGITPEEWKEHITDTEEELEEDWELDARKQLSIDQAKSLED